MGDTAKEINQAGHKVLVDGLFIMPPEAAPEAPPVVQPPKAPAAPGAQLPAPVPPEAPKPSVTVDQFKALTLADGGLWPIGQHAV